MGERGQAVNAWFDIYGSKSQLEFDAASRHRDAVKVKSRYEAPTKITVT